MYHVVLDGSRKVCFNSSMIKAMPMQRIKLKAVTFCVNDKPMNELLWCDKQKRAKRNKPAKINGVQHHEISSSVEHTYYQPI